MIFDNSSLGVYFLINHHPSSSSTTIIIHHHDYYHHHHHHHYRQPSLSSTIIIIIHHHLLPQLTLPLKSALTVQIWQMSWWLCQQDWNPLPNLEIQKSNTNWIPSLVATLTKTWLRVWKWPTSLKKKHLFSINGVCSIVTTYQWQSMYRVCFVLPPNHPPSHWRRSLVPNTSELEYLL